MSLWDAETSAPVFAPRDGRENALMAYAVAGLVAHLPAVTTFGGPTVNSYRRFEADSFAPLTVSWGGDNRTTAIRSMIETPFSTRIELRTPEGYGGWKGAPH